MSRSKNTRPERAARERRIDVRVLFHLRMVLPAGLRAGDVATRIREAHGGSPSGIKREVDEALNRLSTNAQILRGKGRGENIVWHLKRNCMECQAVLATDDGPFCARCTREDH